MKAWQYINQLMQKNFWTSKVTLMNILPPQRCSKDKCALYAHSINLDRNRFKWDQGLIKYSGPTLVISFLLLGCIFIAPTYGVAIEDLKAPIKDLKDTLFGGWMWIPKIGAAVGGCVLAVYNQSIMPLATGAAIGLGIHFYDLYIKAEGALI